MCSNEFGSYFVWQLGISYDKFIRTTDTHHEILVAEFYKRVEEKGDIYQAQYEGLYCVNCEEYKVLAIMAFIDSVPADLHL